MGLQHPKKSLACLLSSNNGILKFYAYRKHVKSDCRNLEEQKSERAIKQILLAAEVNPDCYANFIRRGIDFQAFIEMTAEDLAVIGITKEAEINAILRCTQVLEGTYSKFMDSPAFDM